MYCTPLSAQGDCSAHISQMRSKIPHGCLPCNSSNWKKLVEDCGTSHIENKRGGDNWSQWQIFLVMNLFSLPFRVLLNHSTSPSIWGWWTEVQKVFIFNSQLSCLIIWGTKFGPWFFIISHGTPIQAKIFINSEVTTLPFTEHRCMASGYQVA